MDVLTIIGAINSLTQLATVLTPLAQQAIAVANSQDAAAIEAATTRLANANDAMFATVQQQLRDAGQAG